MSGMRILAVISGEYGQRHVDNLRAHAPADWQIEVLHAYQKLDFDFVLGGDDVAHKTAPFMSPQTFHDLFWPRMKRVADAITLPWIQHSDSCSFQRDWNSRSVCIDLRFT